jgi:hypothetical protein
VIRHIGEGVPVTCGQGRTRLEVTDDETGRGLALLDAVTVRWGVEQGVGSKTVWCEMQGIHSGLRGMVVGVIAG